MLRYHPRQALPAHIQVQRPPGRRQVQLHPPVEHGDEVLEELAVNGVDRDLLAAVDALALEAAEEECGSLWV